MEVKSFGVWDFDKQHKADICGTSDEPYFNGKDVCSILWHADATKAM